MPLPYALNHINLWALDDGAGWAIVDTGVRNEETALVWRELFANAPDQRPLTRVFVTHMHPDHVGMAGWLTRKFGVRLWMTRLEYLTCRVMVSDTGREAPDDAIEFFRRAGWSAAAIETYRARFGNFGKHIHALPDSYRRLRDGEELRIGAQHLARHRRQRPFARARLPVLPGPEGADLGRPDPAADLVERVGAPDRARRRSDERTGSPRSPSSSARCPTTCWCCRRTTVPRPARAHRRARRGQESALQRLPPRSASRSGSSTSSTGCSRARSAKPTCRLLGMATGESLACLNHLLHAEKVECHIDAHGIAWYRLRNETP